MARFINRIITYILERRKKRLEKVKEKLTPKKRGQSSVRTYINMSETMILSAETDKLLETMDIEVKNIVKTCLTDPQKLLDYITEHGTPVYKIPCADKILANIKEEEGFIVPHKGWKAFYLSFFVNLLSQKKLVFSFQTSEMFVLRDREINVYYMLHQFHKWYGFKNNLPGYDEKTQELFKENFENMSDTKELSVDEILALKDAIARDAQAADFVIKLAKENDGAKKALDKMKKDGSAEI